MEPGHEDREYSSPSGRPARFTVPQWSPVMKTGNTGQHGPGLAHDRHASMEPGHEDREYLRPAGRGAERLAASMEPGHEDREYRWAH